jgi:hypothetical protein
MYTLSLSVHKRSTVNQWRRSGLKSGGTNPWRALEILKNNKNLGGQPVLASSTANSGGIRPRPPVIYAHAVNYTYVTYNYRLFITQLSSYTAINIHADIPHEYPNNHGYPDIREQYRHVYNCGNCLIV